jgi:hypothetical protein
MSTPHTTTKTIEITVDPQGAVSVKTNGFSGSACKDASRFIEQALGNSGRETLLPEFYALAQGHADARLGQGNS